METRYEDGESVADAMEAGRDAMEDSSDGVEAQQTSAKVLGNQLNTKGKSKIWNTYIKNLICKNSNKSKFEAIKTEEFT